DNPLRVRLHHRTLRTVPAALLRLHRLPRGIHTPRRQRVRSRGRGQVIDARQDILAIPLVKRSDHVVVDRLTRAEPDDWSVPEVDPRELSEEVDRLRTN